MSYRREALPRIQLWPIAAGDGYGEPEEIHFDSELTSSGLAGNPNWDAPKLRVAATSFVTPLRIYDIDLGSGERTPLREQPCSATTAARTTSEHRDWAVADDGARIPISLIYRAGIDFPAPTVLYGYGAYESSEDPRFSVARLSLLDRGWCSRSRTFAAAARWAGCGTSGQAAGEEEHLHRLHRGGPASRRHRPNPAAEPGGPRRQRRGLLMGAVANLAPELFAASSPRCRSWTR